MTDRKKIRLHQVATELNIGKDTIVDFLSKSGFQITNKPTSVLEDEMINAVIKNFIKEKKLIENLKIKFGLDVPPVTKEPNAPSATEVISTGTNTIETDLDSFFEENIIVGHEVVEVPPIPKFEESTTESKEIVEETAESEIAKEEEKGHQETQYKVGDIIDLTGKESRRAKPKKDKKAGKVIEPENKKEQEKKIDSSAHPKPKEKIKPKDTERQTEPMPKPTEKIIEEEIIEQETEIEKYDAAISEPYEISEPSGLSIVNEIEESYEDKLVQRKWFRKRGGKIRPPKEFGPKKRVKQKKNYREEILENDEEIFRAIRETLHGISEESDVKKRAKIRHRRKDEKLEKEQKKIEELESKRNVLRVSEFITTSELAAMIGVEPTEIISKVFQLGLIVSMNQRLDRDTIILIADDYGYEVEFVEEKELRTQELDFEDPPETLKIRPPIVTIMGHVDHGKTSLLDYIRKSNIVAGESGGITQHIGAYQVEIPDKGFITFIDTPGHEAFTAMRARGAMVTDIVVLVVAADDAVMPQTVEAINHARAANVPIIVAINKIDKPGSNTDRIRQQLAELGILVEEWKGTYQSVEISAKFGTNVDLLLEKILLEAELLELKANPHRPAKATIIESHLDKGRGAVATAIVQKGTLKIGDIFVCGLTFGKVRSMFDEREKKLETAGPSTPVLIVGFDSLPEAGDELYVVETEQIARDIAYKRQQIKREQSIRQAGVVSLDDLSKQIQLGAIKDLNLILKADVTGSLEALGESLIKLTYEEVKVNILHKGVGNVNESDVTLAAASNAVVIAFRVSSTGGARKLAEKLSVEIRKYDIIYECINEIKLALEGLLSPEVQEVVTATLEVRQTFRISKVGTIAGCYVQNGKVTRSDKIRVIREGLVIHTGTISSLRRGKDDVREVDAGYECGLMIHNFNDVEINDILETYKLVEVRKTLETNK